MGVSVILGEYTVNFLVVMILLLVIVVAEILVLLWLQSNRDVLTSFENCR